MRHSARTIRGWSWGSFSTGWQPMHSCSAAGLIKLGIGDLWAVWQAEHLPSVTALWIFVPGGAGSSRGGGRLGGADGAGSAGRVLVLRSGAAPLLRREAADIAG